MSICHSTFLYNLLTRASSTISLGKYGSFQANHIIGRPYHLTFEILGDGKESCLRIVGAEELYQHIKEEEDEATPEALTPVGQEGGVEYEVVNPEGKVVMRTNRDINDSTETQKLTSDDIEMLKREETASGKNVIAKIMESHTALDKKTAFALAKYTLRKAKKYLRRFTVLPLDVTLLTYWILHEKDSAKIMEIREEILGLVCSWSNAHYVPSGPDSESDFTDSNRWLVVDETSGLIVAAIAERLGILYPSYEESIPDRTPENEEKMCSSKDVISEEDMALGQSTTDDVLISTPPSRPKSHAVAAQESAMSATSNSITVVHANTQTNLSFLNYFSYDQFNSNPSHPLHTNLRTLSWLQLLSPQEDSAYREPETSPDSEITTWKSGKKSAYYRKRRRWTRVKSVVDETRNGGFAGLVVASVMAPATILHHLVPLLRGGAQVVVYSPNIEPLTELVDCYSTARRTAFAGMAEAPEIPSGDFPLNPMLLLASTIYTQRARPWQVLPGRTHPKMTGKGGADGYVFVGTRVLPAEGRITARGSYKRRKTADRPDVGSSDLKDEALVDQEVGSGPLLAEGAFASR